MAISITNRKMVHQKNTNEPLSEILEGFWDSQADEIAMATEYPNAHHGSAFYCMQRKRVRVLRPNGTYGDM